ncbi:hypothetical protein [Parvularcula sp. IMCC14364]|uniref:hypothetical protein n=1 Tax=Parvularcula sp. IMCC14364 TaxID=3067902 RepID=UPI0027406C7D|nr:hypothetical protein [Parvularcula sp. IMCC14364]
MAQSPSAGAQGDQALSYSDLQAQGYILFQPSDVKQKLLNSGFLLQSEQATPDGVAKIYSMTAGQQVFLFGFSDCQSEGCLFMRAIHPIPTAAAGLNISTGMVNDLNGTTPLGHYVVEQGGNVSLRYYVPAVPECAEACLDSHLLLFMNGTKAAHETLQRVGRQRVAGADAELIEKADIFAAGARGQGEAFDAKIVSALTVQETPFAAKNGFAGVENTLVDVSSFTGFEYWKPDFGSLIPEEPEVYDSKILNQVD